MKKFSLVLISTILFTSCLTPKSEPVPEKEVIEEVIPEVKTPVVIEENIVEDDNFVATEAVYEKTFDEVEELIIKLNRIISTGNFNTWKEYLSEEYIESHGNKEYLAKLSENIVLKNYGIQLKSLKDYFNYIVTPARSNVAIDEIQFIDEDNLKVFTYKNSDKFVVYILTRSDSGWIISD